MNYLKLSKVHHISDMSQISAEGLNHYAVVCGLNNRKLKESIAGHQSAQWKSKADCFRDIHIIGTG